MKNRIFADSYCRELVNFDTFSHIYIIAFVDYFLNIG